MARQKAVSSNPMPKLKPAYTPEARESQMVALAMDLVEQRLRDGTASSQETTHFLKLVSSKAKLEQERAKLENELIAAKTKALRDAEEMKSLYEDAIKAMRRYSGHGDEDEY
jgi:chemotaxis methyl-accepting protein methylase